jgi:hypothetical protein
MFEFLQVTLLKQKELKKSINQISLLNLSHFLVIQQYNLYTAKSGSSRTVIPEHVAQ